MGVKRVTTEEYIKRAKAVHGDKYDYSKTVYLSMDDKVTVTCKTHGDFDQRGDSHLIGRGCRKCSCERISESRRMSQDEFLDRCNTIHDSFYDYSKVIYETHRHKIIIGCPIHGDFLQSAGTHMRGADCPKCAIESIRMSRRLNTDDFINKAKEIHGDTYDYSRVDYVDARTRVYIGCKTHGYFQQTPAAHKSGHGCPTCGDENRALSTEAFIERSKEIHGDIYDYTHTNYVRSKQKVAIKCKEHGIFYQKPHHHLEGVGCAKCGFQKNTSNTEEFINKAIALFGDNTYDYSSVVYVNNQTKVSIGCSTHGKFWQTPNSHLSGNGCPYCKVGGFNPRKPGILYYLRIDRRNFDSVYKIGITNSTVEKRFSNADLSLITVIKTWSFEFGYEALFAERHILNKYKEYKYSGENILKSGNTELFTMDVLDLDNGVCVSTP